MKKISLVFVAAYSLAIATTLTSCSDSKSADNYVGSWAQVNESEPSFSITKTEQGLSLQAAGESNSINVTASGNSLTVDGTTFSYDEQKQELSTPGLFDTQIVFKKLPTEQK